MSQDNGKIIWDSLIKNGFNEIATSGIMGNLKAESSFDPTIANGGAHYQEVPNIGENGPDYGIAQWYFYTRKDGLANLAAARGRHGCDLMVQIDYLILEIDQYGLKNSLNQSATPFDAAILFHNDFEKSADTPEQAKRRGIYAEEIYKKKGEGCADIAYDGDFSSYTFGGSLPGTIGGMSSMKSTQTPHGKHSDTVFQNPPKTFCEPVYPDLVSINSKIPEITMQDIAKKANETELISGPNMVYTVPANLLTKYGGSDYLKDQTMSAEIENQRKISFNVKKHSKAYKLPSAGKPPNNNDPFPFDSKIEEFELHSPRCKIEKIQTCPEAVNVARACMQLSVNVEKRIVRLENNMATMMRYLGRMASRVAINCVYYGGQAGSDFEKYKCIRCLQDDRISDGQTMSIDQCLTCTRYEPIIGQVYDILNDEGINLSQVLDDCQMSYTTAEEYCKFITSTEHQKILETQKLGKDDIAIRNIKEKDFKDIWSQGIKMDWKLFPVEEQRPHINKTQNINGDQCQKLVSYPGSATNFGSMYCANSKGSRMKANKDLMDAIIKKDGEKK